MEEDPACCVLAGGAMSELAAKLDGLLIRSQGRRRHMLIPWEVKNELIPLIKKNLEIMMAIIQDSGDDKSSREVIRCLMKEVRELFYDIHDCIDEHAAGPASDHATRLLWRMELHVSVAKATDKRRRSTVVARRRTSSKPKPTWLSERLKGRLWLLDKMREFSARSEEALRRYTSFNRLVKEHRNEDNHGDSSTSGKSTRSCQSFGPWSPPPNANVLHRRTGMHDLAMNTLKAWLTDGDSPKLKVVSMVGCGGLGKTTLANELYREIRGQYECRAFVRTSQKPDVRRLLISIISQIRPQEPPGNWKVHNLIGDIRTHLQDKRYLIVIDDVWARSTWDILHRAFPDGNHYSRILITSELEDVALKCCGYEPQYVYKMKLLSEDDSRKLFYSIVVCPQELSVVSNSIIRKCGGLPLAIVTIASFLASRMGKTEQKEFVEYVDKSLGYDLMTKPTLEGMKQVVSLGYRNLPQHLKACMLYLCIFPEDFIIWTDDLVKQWIAEGFIFATEGKDEEEISRGYFDELISSRLIHPIHIDGSDKVLSCTMHHVMRNHIMQESSVENFVAAIDYSQTATRFAHKVRRLSLHFGNAEDATLSANMRLSQVRTLAFFGAFKCLPSITEFRLLQILILHLWSEEESIKFDLTSISEIFRLRYLQVTCNVALEIQQMQMLRRLQYLETLKIDAARGSIMPSDAVHLPRLLHLRLPADTNIPSGIGQMTSLRTLGHFDLSTNSIEGVRSLGELTNVQDLQLTCTPMGPSHYLVKQMECLSSVLGKLNNLKCLTLKRSRVVHVDCQPSSMSVSCDVLSSVSSPPVLLQRLEWLPRICTFSRLPEWIGHLGKLCILKIGVRELVKNDVDLLKGLPALTVLSLFVHSKPAEIVVFTKGGFLVLKYFRFRCSVPCLKFEADVMPNLRKLKLGFDAHEAIQYNHVPSGLDHLSGLEEISAKIGGARASEPVIRIVESAFRDAIWTHPRHPTVNIQCVLPMFGNKDDLNISLQQEKCMIPQKHYEPIEEDSNEQHVTIQKGSRKDAASSMFRELPPPPVRWSSVAETTSGLAWDIVNSFAPRKENSELRMSYEHVEIPHLSDTEEENDAEENDEGFAGAEEGLKGWRVGETFEGFTGTSSKNDDDTSSMSSESLFYISPHGKFKRKIRSWTRGMLLGSGSFGTVYEGISDEGVFFAVKEVSLLDQGSNAQPSILALEQEIALLSDLEHENIVHYYGTDKEESKLYIFTELVTQGSLLSLYQKYKLRDTHVSAYTRQILNGLVYLHERNVVHSDIRCANILIHANGSVKLADFGLAKEMSKINMLRSFKGNVYWMAPEVVNPNKTYGPAADVWSLGCTVLEMLTRQIPYPDVEWINAFSKIERGEQPPIPSNLSQRARDFINHCLRVDPEERPTVSKLLAHPFVDGSLRGKSVNRGRK